MTTLIIIQEMNSDLFYDSSIFKGIKSILEIVSLFTAPIVVYLPNHN